ncbi:BQ2448_7082 [Microbotryum intermedium]|uniref:BQ2448_7082 protein n=1 Tax=Microbotryum intermedium TaxID=269621 RepID=A0A238FIT1_9BASI|nr:BQ2448_7082 [Microbotryum intermedium]
MLFNQAPVRRIRFSNCSLPKRTTATGQTPQWSRLVRFIPSSSPHGSEAVIGEPVDASLDVGRAIYEAKQPVKVNLYSGTTVLDAGQATGEQAEIGELLSPLGQDEVGTIRCIGLNYRKHAKEASLPIPTVPILFLKPSTALTGPYPSKIIIPRSVVADEAADYESELAVVMGKDCKDVTEETALDYVLGYTAGNDVSSRKVQFEQSQWCFSKGFDTACPIGPVIVSTSSIPDPSKLVIKGHKTDPNGQTKTLQDSPLNDLIFPIPKIISFLSRGTTLKAGTVILTGTPSGIGFFYDPKETLVHGSTFTVEVSDGIGSLINEVIEEGK